MMQDIGIHCDALPPKQELNRILAQYYDLIVQRMGDMGFAIAGPAKRTGGILGQRHDYLPPNGCLLLARSETGQIVGCGMLKRLDRRAETGLCRRGRARQPGGG